MIMSKQAEAAEISKSNSTDGNIVIFYLFILYFYFTHGITKIWFGKQTKKKKYCVYYLYFIIL